MGLTLNSNSLTLESAGGGGGSTGLTEAQVKTLISDNTPYQHIASVDADSAASVDFDDIPAYSSYKIVLDNLMPATSSNYCMMRFYKTVGTPHSVNDYYYNIYYGNSSGASGFDYSSGQSAFNLNQISHYQYGIAGEIEVSALASQPAIVRWSLAMGSGTQALRFDGAGFWNDVAQPVGFQFYPSSGSWYQGKVHLYGVNA